MADDLKCNHWAVAKWWQRDSIPPEWWTEVVAAAHRAGHTAVTVDLLAAIAAGKRKEAA